MKSILLFTLITCISFPAFAQEEDQDDIDYSLPVPDWKAGLKKGKVDGWLYSTADAPEQITRMASSAHEKYPARNAMDNNTTSAWVPATNGGIGEVVVVDYSPGENKKQMVWIWSGYGKTKALFQANNRPRKIRIYLLGTYCHDCTPSVCMTGNFVVLAKAEKELKDLNGFQEITLPKGPVIDNSADCSHPSDAESPYRYRVAIEILSIYKGSKYNDTCITEIMADAAYQKWLAVAKKGRGL